MSSVVVLGTGMAGLGAAYRLSQDGVLPRMYDKNAAFGGQTRSFRYDTGFTFDLGPHISFTKDARIQALFADSVGDEYETLQVRLNNHWHGHWPRHPVQANLHGLPEDVIIKVIADFVEERQAPERPINNYHDWLLASFGRTFAELFPLQYTRKYHLAPAENMSTDWLGPRVYRPSLEEVLQGALSPASTHEHYITHFRYPRRGGFVSFLQKFAPLGDMRLQHELVAVDPHARQVSFANGHVTGYDALISSVPLPSLVPMIKGVPDNVVEASRRLACSTCVLVNVGVDRTDLSPAHVTYVYDDDVCFTRLSFPHMLSPDNAPEGAGSIQAEVYFSPKYKPLTGTPEDWIEPVIRDLRRVGLVRESDTILHRNAVVLPYANVIFDLDRSAALAIVHDYLDDIGIAYCGRYGEWGYMWTDESFRSGEAAAQKVLPSVRRASPNGF